MHYAHVVLVKNINIATEHFEKMITVTKKPIIGVVLDYVTPDNQYGYTYSELPWYSLRKNYADSVISAGGIPIMIPYGKIEDYFKIVNGLIIPGCDSDVPPDLYNEPIMSNKVTLNPDRTKFDFDLAKEAISRNVPLLGVCYGMQLINVIYGGTLIQDLPSSNRRSNIDHMQKSKKNIVTHDITITEGSKLCILNGNLSKDMVNSAHHQAVEKLGKGLVASAIANDFIIEAIEDPTLKFLIGVQWHPEYNNTLLDKNLFKELIKKSAELI